VKKSLTFWLSLLIISLLIFTGCASNAGTASNTEVEELKSEIAQLNKTIESLKKANKEHRDANVQLTKDLEKITFEYEQYQAKMSEYEGLAADEFEARKLQAEKEKEEAAAKKAEEEEAARIAKEEEEAAKAAEEAKGYETGITYNQIARNPTEYMGQKVKFKGTVVQLIEGTIFNQLRFAIDDDYNQIIFLEYDPSHLSERVLEDDTLTIYGISVGTITYESTMGGNITIPAVDVDKIEIHY
jgi:outer membrane murein-binding lipoprotein Lpp